MGERLLLQPCFFVVPLATAVALLGRPPGGRRGHPPCCVQQVFMDFFLYMVVVILRVHVLFSSSSR